MQIIKTERIEFSQKEYEAFEMVLHIADRLQYAATNPSIVLAAEQLENVASELLAYCVPNFAKESEFQGAEASLFSCAHFITLPD